MIKLSDNGFKFIAEREELKLEAYLDQAEIPTIGYGTIVYADGKRVKLGDKINEDSAQFHFKYEVNSKANSIDKLISVSLNQNQQDALISLVYNIGIEAFRHSTIRILINKGEPTYSSEFKKHWLEWDKVHIDGKLVQSKGLKARRKMEYELYTKPINYYELNNASDK